MGSCQPAERLSPSVVALSCQGSTGAVGDCRGQGRPLRTGNSHRGTVRRCRSSSSPRNRRRRREAASGGDVGRRRLSASAVQLGTVRFLGAFLPDPAEVPWAVAAFIAETHLGIGEPSALKDYGARTMTCLRAPVGNPAGLRLPGLPQRIDDLRRFVAEITRPLERLGATTPGWTLHQLRHSAPAHLGERNVGLQTFMAKTRHANPRSAMRYIKPGAGSRRPSHRLPRPRARAQLRTVQRSSPSCV